MPAAKGAAPVVAGPRLRGRRVVIVEEHEGVRSLVRDILESEGARCLASGDVRGLPPLTDDGRGSHVLILADSPRGRDLKTTAEAFQRILGRSCPRLFLTYSARQQGFDEDLGDCLNKPFLADDLVAAVRRATDPADGTLPERAGEAGGAKAPPATLAGMSVLVAEDNDIAARVVVTLLQKQGAAVTRVRDGENALSRAREGGFAAAFVDLRMPRLGGIEFARAFRAGEERGVRLPIVALTADAAEDVRARCLAAGIDDFLGKPVKPGELIAMARRFAPNASTMTEAAS